MIKIEDLKDNIISLVKTEDNVFEKEFTVTSKKSNGSVIPFSVEIVSSNYIQANTFGTNGLKLVVDTPNIQKDEYIIIKNSKNERTKLIFKPNPYFTMERKYKFKITRESIDKDGKLKLKILSKVNDMELGWKCTYMGQPISYDIAPINSNKSDYVIISNKVGNIILSDFHSLFKFTQNESNNVIRYQLHNTPNGIIIDKKDGTK